VVEGDRDLRQLNAGALIHCGYAVGVAEDGATAWEALQAHGCDLLITDNKMPKLTGIELLKNRMATDSSESIIRSNGHQAANGR
jgi:DNA-binding response OmpR family regulator